LFFHFDIGVSIYGLRELSLLGVTDLGKRRLIALPSISFITQIVPISDWNVSKLRSPRQTQFHLVPLLSIRAVN
jgi:hypothetical protein